MTLSPPTIQNILSFSGFDPSGGAGIQADIETISALGGHATPVITATTVQNTQNVDAVFPTDVHLFQQQIDKLAEDMTFAAIKIGLLGNIEITQAVVRFLRKQNLPVVFDPVLASGAGDVFSTHAHIQVIKSELLPWVTLITPNRFEARQLTGQSNLDQCAQVLHQQGCRHVLITGTDETPESDTHVHHRFYANANKPIILRAKRLPHAYHGSGCTLASAIAYHICHLPYLDAIKAAQAYTWRTLASSHQIGRGQRIPNRVSPHV